MRNGVCAPVKLIAVLRFIYPNAPKHDRRVMHVLPNHLVGVFDGLPLPVLVADVLPAGYLSEHEKSELITARYEVL